MLKYATWMTLVFFLGGASSLASTVSHLQGVNSQFEGEELAVYLDFDKPVDTSQVELEFINQTIQLNIPDARIREEKNLVRLGKNKFRSIYTYQQPGQVLRTRIILAKSLAATDYKESIQVHSEGNSLRILIKPPNKEWVQQPLPVIPPLDLNSALEKEVAQIITPRNDVAQIVAPKKEQHSKSAAKILAKEIDVALKPSKNEGSGPEAVAEKSLAAQARLKESEIPVLTSGTKKKQASSSPYSRMLVSLAIIALLAGGLVLFSKRWARNSKVSLGNNKIRVVTQHHLGPRKSLAIIRVAGEHILVGVTDHNISMIKSLSLIDDEVPAETPHSFASAMSSASTDTYDDDDDKEDFAFGNIKDSVTRRLREMRQI